jgi:bifunctional non-homologous end joining protein LigD
VFTSDQVLQRVEKMGDLFEPALKLKQKLPAIESLQELAGDAKLDADITGAAKVQSIASAAKHRKPIRRKSVRKG